jgi:hypothetical protein
MVKSNLDKAITLSSMKPWIWLWNLWQNTWLWNSNNIEDNEIIESYKVKFEDLLQKWVIKQASMQTLFLDFVDLYNKWSLVINDLKYILDQIIEDVELDFKSAQKRQKKAKKFF